MRYIGIDIGDGESSVAYLDEASVIEPKILPIDGAGSILSIVGMAGTDVIIGERALTNQNVVHLRTRFKSKYLTSADAKRDIERFAYGIKAFLQAEHGIVFDDDTYVAVGCPAGWSEKDRALYLEIMSKAGLENVHIISESRAAFFYARYAHELNIAPEILRKTTLVIDIGSSTTDFAYIVNGRESTVGTFGDVNLGGGLIEACMLNKAVMHSQNRAALEDVFTESVSWRNRCEITARRLKEQYFLDEEKWKNLPCVASEMIYYDEPIKVRFELNERIISDIISTPMEELNGTTFAEALSDLLRHAQRSTREYPPALIILTGGASRMAFFRAACKKEFPDAEVVICPEPEYSIAKGLAYAGRVDRQLEAFYADIDAYFCSGEVAREVSDCSKFLTVPLASILSGRIIDDVVLSVLDDWKKGAITSVNDMSEPIMEKTKELLGRMESIPEIKPAINDWVRRLFEHIQPRLDAICSKHNVDHSEMTLADVNAAVCPEKVELLLETPLADTLTYVVTGALSAAICGGSGFALIAAGPLGIIIGALIGVILGYFGKKYIDKSVNRADLSLTVRKMLCLSFKRSLKSPRQRKKLEDALCEVMSRPDFSARLEEEIRKSLQTQITALARNVEMPIVQ